MMAGKNETTNEFEGSKRFRALHQARQAALRAGEKRIAAAHRLPSGPKFEASQEPQPRLKAPKIRRSR
jgi:hypothetical protein